MGALTTSSNERCSGCPWPAGGGGGPIGRAGKLLNGQEAVWERRLERGRDALQPFLQKSQCNSSAPSELKKRRDIGWSMVCVVGLRQTGEVGECANQARQHSLQLGCSQPNGTSIGWLRTHLQIAQICVSSTSAVKRSMSNSNSAANDARRLAKAGSEGSAMSTKASSAGCSNAICPFPDPPTAAPSPSGLERLPAAVQFRARRPPLLSFFHRSHNSHSSP